MCLNISHIAIITVDYRCIMYNINKSEAINLLEKPVLKDCGHLSGNIVYSRHFSINNGWYYEDFKH